MQSLMTVAVGQQYISDTTDSGYLDDSARSFVESFGLFFPARTRKTSLPRGMMDTDEFWTDQGLIEAEALALGIDSDEWQPFPVVVPQLSVEQFRQMVAIWSFTLSHSGIAPRFQGLIGKWQGTSISWGRDEFKKVIQDDGWIYDAFWLWREFRADGLKTNRNYREFYSGDGVNWVLARMLRDRDGSVAEKLKVIGIEEWRSAGCIRWIGCTTKDRVNRFMDSRTLEREFKEHYKEARRHLNDKQASLTSRRAVLAEAACQIVMGEGEGMAVTGAGYKEARRIMSWVDGETISKESFARTRRQAKKRKQAILDREIVRNMAKDVRATSRDTLVSSAARLSGSEVAGCHGGKLMSEASKGDVEPVDNSKRLSGSDLEGCQGDAKTIHVNNMVTRGDASLLRRAGSCPVIEQEVEQAIPGYRVWIGIDPGASGAIAAIVETGQGNEVVLCDIPTKAKDYGKGQEVDGRKLKGVLEELGSKGREICVVIEGQHQRKNDKVSDWFALRGNYDSIKVIVDAVLAVKPTIVDPAVWKREIGLTAIRQKTKTGHKLLSKNVVGKVFRDVRIYRHDEAEALLLAFWLMTKDYPDARKAIPAAMIPSFSDLGLKAKHYRDQMSDEEWAWLAVRASEQLKRDAHPEMAISAFMARAGLTELPDVFWKALEADNSLVTGENSLSGSNAAEAP